MSEQLKLEDEEVSITLRRAWDRALRSLAIRVNKPTFETHIRAIKPVSLVEGDESGKPVYVVTLGVPSAFTREWVQQRHMPLIASVLEEILDRDVRVQFVLSPRDTGPVVAAQTALPFDSVPSPTQKRPANRPTATPSRRSPAASPSPEPVAEVSLLPGPEFELTPVVPPARATTTSSVAPAQSRPTPTSALTASGQDSGPKTAFPRSSSSSGGGIAPSPDAPPLNPRYTFDSFVVGVSNRLAHAGAHAVAQSPGQVYNPLFIYGPPGMGKTHLMHAIGNEISRHRGTESSRVAYVSGEAFTSHFITSLREHRTEEFRRRWRSVDLWLVDDIQFIAGKESTKEEFFHTFNTLYQMGKQIVISSDRSPRELRAMDERLRSRFECGLIADIAPPDLETRLAILHRKAEIERMRIPDEVLLYMAKLIQSNIRTLEGALVKLIAYASLQNSPVTCELASSILERYYISAGVGDTMESSRNSDYGMPGNAGNGGMGTVERPSPPSAGSARTGMSGVYSGKSHASYGTGGFGTGAGVRGVTADLVQRVVAKRFGLAPDALTGKRRDRDIVIARQIAMHLLRELTEMSLPGIGQMFGGRDHSTVSHACDRVRSQLPLDDDLKSLIEDLMIQLKAQASG